jgi:hypothetical protein
MKRIAAGARITRSPGAPVHVARVPGLAGWIALCGKSVYRPTVESANLIGSDCDVCVAIVRASAGVPPPTNGEARS